MINPVELAYRPELKREEKAALLLAAAYDVCSEVGQTELLDLGPFPTAPVSEGCRARAVDVAEAIAALFPHECKIAEAASAELAAPECHAMVPDPSANAHAAPLDYEGSLRRVRAMMQRAAAPPQ